MKRFALCLAFGAVIAASASADLSATGYMTWTQDGSSWDYDIWLTNNGTTNVGTLWYSWIPGFGYLPDPPTNISGPAGWNSGVATDEGMSIQWIATTTPLAPGQTIDGFKFTSVDSPTILAGNSSDGTPIGTSFVYHAGPFSDAGFQFVINPNVVPEPATYLGLGLGAVALLRRRNRRS